MQKTILITGATSGFGAATARQFADNDWKVIATGRRLDRLEAFRGAYPEGQIHIAQMDLTDREQIVAAIAGLPDDFRRIDCLVNNGGLALGKEPVPDIELDDWHRMIDTNVTGLIHMTLEAVPLLKAAGPGALIVNIGSVAARYPYPGGNVYGATKAFVKQFSRNLRTDLADTDIRVTNLDPGMAKTEFTTVRNHGDESANDAFYKGMKPIQPEDIAETVWWLASRPAHININEIEIMPVAQTPGPFKVRRD